MLDGENMHESWTQKQSEHCVGDIFTRDGLLP